MRYFSLAIIGTIGLGMMLRAQTADSQQDQSAARALAAQPITIAPRAPAKVHAFSGSPSADPADAINAAATHPVQIIRGRGKAVHQVDSSNELTAIPDEATLNRSATRLVPAKSRSPIRTESATPVIALVSALVSATSPVVPHDAPTGDARSITRTPVSRLQTLPTDGTTFQPLAALPQPPMLKPLPRKNTAAEALQLKAADTVALESLSLADHAQPQSSSKPADLGHSKLTPPAAAPNQATNVQAPIQSIAATAVATTFEPVIPTAPPATPEPSKPPTRPRLPVGKQLPLLPTSIAAAPIPPLQQPSTPRSNPSEHNAEPPHREVSSDQRTMTRVPDALRPIATTLPIAAPLPAGALPAGALPAGALPAGALPAGALPAGALPVHAATATQAGQPLPFKPAAETLPTQIGEIDSVAQAIHQQADQLDQPNHVQVVTHQETSGTSASQANHITELVVGTLPNSSRRITQVGGQFDLDDNDNALRFDQAPTAIEVPAAERPAAEPPAPLVPPQVAAKQIAKPQLAIPMRTAPPNSRASIDQQDGLYTLVATEEELRDILRMIANHHKLNLVIGPNVQGPVTVNIRGARLEEMLDAILGVAGFHWHQSGNLLYVTGTEIASLDPKVQGRRLQVYPLNYVSARDIEPVVTSLLTPIGKVFTSEADSLDQLRTRELLVVEDNESGHHRVAQYLAQVDIQPRQVLVEAHVLQIDLSDEERQGVNLRGLLRISGAKVSLEGSNFAEDNPDGPSLAFRIDGTDVDHLIEAIHTNTNSRTLASPKVSVVNRQTAKVQIGQRLPYAVATTTQTATIQNVQFLDVGIVLEVTPVITQDGNILMTVLPKVSGGKITESGFPEEDTTQVSTTVLMPDGSGLVIGGLIREVDSETTAMVPKLGKVPVIKHLFNKRATENRRNELVVALVTHIIDGANPVRQKECLDLQTALPDHAARELHYTPEIRYSTR